MASLRKQTGVEDYKPLNDTSVEKLPGNLCRFFAVAVKKDGSLYNSSTIEQYFQRFQTWCLRTHKIDINQDPLFASVKDVVKKRCTDGVKAGQRPGINASRAVPEDLIKQAVDMGKFGRDSPQTLIRTVVYHMMTGMGQRAIKVWTFLLICFNINYNHFLLTGGT